MAEKLINVIIDHLPELLILAYIIFSNRAKKETNEIQRDRNEIERERISIKVLEEKLALVEALKSEVSTINQHQKDLQIRLDEQVRNNTAMSRVIEDQDRKIKQQTTDLAETNRRLGDMEKENKELRKDNAEKGLTISTLTNEKDLALARLEGVMSVVGKIHVEIAKIEIKQEGE